jgi:hypothetical protein
MRQEISNAEYQACQDQMLLLARMVRDMPLVDFLQAISRAEAVGPMVDPTLYIRGRDKLEEIKLMAEGLRKFQLSLPSISEALKEPHKLGLR